MSLAENAFRNDLVKALKQARGKQTYIQKHHGSAYSAGLPDMLVVDLGEPSMLELKAVQTAPKLHTSIGFNWKEVTALQREALLAHRLAGGMSRVLIYVKPSAMVVSVAWDEEKHARFREGFHWTWEYIQPGGALQQRQPKLEQRAGVIWAPWEGSSTPWNTLHPLVFGA